VPFDTTVRAFAHLPRHLFLELSQHVLRNISCFRLRAHKLRGETATWNSGNSPICDRCDCAQVQDEVHALFMCRDVGSCALRRKYAHLFSHMLCWWSFSGATIPYTCHMVTSGCTTSSCSSCFWFPLAVRQPSFLFCVWAYGFAVDWRGPVTGRSAEQSGWRSPHVTLYGQIWSRPLCYAVGGSSVDCQYMPVVLNGALSVRNKVYYFQGAGMCTNWRQKKHIPAKSKLKWNEWKKREVDGVALQVGIKTI